MEGNLEQFEPKRHKMPPLPRRSKPPIPVAEPTVIEYPPSDRAEDHIVGKKSRGREAYVNPSSPEAKRLHEEAAQMAKADLEQKAKRQHQFEEEKTLPKVIISAEGLASGAEAQKWEHARAGAEHHTKELARIERIRFNSEKDREGADRLISQFEARLRDKRRGIEDDDMDRFAEKFSASQRDLERWQEEARFLPPIKAGKDDARALTDANYETIRRLERAIAASKFPPQQALGELIHGHVGAMELETEEHGKNAEEIADAMSAKIEATYGAAPEDLIQGHGPLGKRLKFTLKNWLGRISGQETDFDRWQRAERDKQSAELARMERLPHERKRRFTAEEKQRQEKISLAQRLEAEKATSEMRDTRAKQKNEWDDMVAEEIDIHETPTIEAKEVSSDSSEAREVREALDEYVTPTIETKKVRISKKERIAIQKTEEAQRDEPEIEVAPIGRPSKKSALPLKQKFEAAHRAARAVAETTPLELTKKPIITEKPARRPLEETAKNEAINKDALAEAKKKEEESKWMTVEKAATLVPYSAAIWDRVKKQFEQNPSAVSAFPVEEWPNPKEHPITNYVLLIAKYYEAKKAGDKEQAKRSYATLKKFATALGIPEHDMLTIPNKLKPSGIVKRADTVSKQERRWKT